MSKKDKLGLDKVVTRINKEFEKTSSQFDKLVSDAFKQLDNLQSQIHEPIKKIMEDMDKIRDREVSRFQSEFDKRMKEFSELQSQLLDKLGMENKKKGATPTKTTATKKSSTTTKTSAKKTTAKKTAAKKPATAKSTTRKPAAKKPAAKKAPAAKKPAAAKKAPAAKKPTAAKPATKPTAKASNELTKLAGVGPALAKRLNDAGITTLKQIANPSDSDKKALEAFSKTKGFATWQPKAQELSK
ncbi:MAG: hypothetical protein R3183_09180 [Oleiphilaceae bacterium]|nr:hypothetical protein [Oleiphilaceae bacterium]